MEKSLNDLVLEKMDEITSLIENEDTYKRFIELKKVMASDKEIMDLINNIKKKQQELVKKESRKEDISNLDKEINKMIDELNSYPIYSEYNYLLEDINEELQEVKFVIENYLNNKIN